MGGLGPSSSSTQSRLKKYRQHPEHRPTPIHRSRSVEQSPLYSYHQSLRRLSTSTFFSLTGPRFSSQLAPRNPASYHSSHPSRPRSNRHVRVAPGQALAQRNGGRQWLGGRITQCLGQAHALAQWMSCVSRAAHQVRSRWVVSASTSNSPLHPQPPLTPERPECKRCVNYGAECVYPVKKAFDAAAVDAALGSRHNRPSNVAATAAAFHVDVPGPMGMSGRAQISPPPALPPLIAANQPPRADQRSTIEDLPPIEMVHALFRKTKMGSFFNNPGMTPPEFLQDAFPNAEDLRCVRISKSLC